MLYSQIAYSNKVIDISLYLFIFSTISLLFLYFINKLLYIFSIKSFGELILIFQLQYFNKAFSAKKQHDKFIL